MDCDLACSVAWMGKVSGPADQAGIDEEKRHRFGDGRRLHHDSGELVDAVHDLGKLAEHGLQLLYSGVQGGGVFKFQAGRGLVALRGDLPHQRVAAAVEVGLHAGHFGAVFVVVQPLKQGARHIFISE